MWHTETVLMDGVAAFMVKPCGVTSGTGYQHILRAGTTPWSVHKGPLSSHGHPVLWVLTYGQIRKLRERAE